MDEIVETVNDIGIFDTEHPDMADEVANVTESIGRAKGGKARQAKMSKEQRSALASEAAKRRWAKKKSTVLTDVQEMIQEETMSMAELDETVEQVSEAMISSIQPVAENIAKQVALSEPPKQKRRRKPVPKAFGAAGSYAKKRLDEAIKERAEAMGRVAALNAEIPSLVQIIKALEGSQIVPVQDLTAQVPVPYDTPQLVMDAPYIPPGMRTPQLPATPMAMGGAVDTPELNEADEDQFLKNSGLPGGKWM
jgi:hypothetical protein